MSSQHAAVAPYQFAVRTSRPPDAILEDLAQRGMAGVALAERGSSYIVLRPTARFSYSREVAVVTGLVTLLIILAATAITPLFIALLPLSLAPAIPFLLDRRPMLAISAVSDEESLATVVTAHGQASAELSAALDAYLTALPSQPVDAAESPSASEES